MFVCFLVLQDMGFVVSDAEDVTVNIHEEIIVQHRDTEPLLVLCVSISFSGRWPKGPDPSLVLIASHGM